MFRIVLISLTLVLSTGLHAASTYADGSGEDPAKIGAQVEELDYNFRVNPLGLLQGFINAELDFAISRRVTLGPTFYYWGVLSSLGVPSITGFGIRLNTYLTRDVFQSGVYLGTSLGYGLAGDAPSHASVGSSPSTATQNGVFGTLVAGYQWMLEGGFNMNAGGGLIYQGFGGDYSEVGPVFEVTLGYAF